MIVVQPGEGAMGATVATVKGFGINNNNQFKNVKLHTRSSL